LALERGDLAAARRHLEAAAEARPEEPAVTRALEVLERRESGSSHGGSRSSSRGAGKGTRGKGGGPSGAGASAGSGHGSGPGQGSATGPGWAAETSDPARLFDALADEAPFLGAVVLDEQGLVLAGRIDVDGAGEELLGALINTAVDEARRTTELLGLGEWDGMLLDGDQATLHVAELADGAVVLMAVRSDAPSGWAVRTAERAQALARDFLEERG
ncbi:MAG: roadblock/LC7 domain-containing protein, partial [Longimicrobiales bacterium]|nr:roadblock/LC7 domain-containing protein [Longimicrobiales bacterium]